MTYQELVDQVRNRYESLGAEGIQGHYAYQFNVSGEAEGAFYLKISEEKVEVMPYEYYDRNVLFFLPTEVLLALFEGSLNLFDAVHSGSIGSEGDLEQAGPLQELVDRYKGRNGQVRESGEVKPDREILEEAEEAKETAGGETEAEAKEAQEAVESVSEEGQPAAVTEDTYSENASNGQLEFGLEEKTVEGPVRSLAGSAEQIVSQIAGKAAKGTKKSSHGGRKKKKRK